MLRSDRAIHAAACEYARAWSGADLASQVQNTADGLVGGSIPDSALLAAAVAATQKRPA